MVGAVVAAEVLSLMIVEAGDVPKASTAATEK